MIYSSLITQIKALLGTVASVKEVFAHPTSKINKYPCAIFFPSDFQNTFSGFSVNDKVYRFKLYIVVGGEQTTGTTIFETLLPKVVDEVIEKFDAGWSLLNIDGHRCWGKIDSGSWSLNATEKGIEATAEMNIEVKFSNNN